METQRHGGFNIGDEVEVRMDGKWVNDHFHIERFDGMSVLAGNWTYSTVVQIYDIRHPHLVQKEKKA